MEQEQIKHPKPKPEKKPEEELEPLEVKDQKPIIKKSEEILGRIAIILDDNEFVV